MSNWIPRWSEEMRKHILDYVNSVKTKDNAKRKFWVGVAVLLVFAAIASLAV